MTNQVLTITEAAAEARSMNWSKSTHSVGFMVQLFDKEFLFYFNSKGDVVGCDRDGQFESWEVSA
jgi:hypothetical protein